MAAAASLGIGAAGGVLWWLIVKPPAYELNSNGGAATSERGLSQFIAGDAWFCAIGLVVGLLIGLAAWRWLRDLGWSVVLVVLVCATASALTCWLVGYRLGPVISRLAGRSSARRSGADSAHPQGPGLTAHVAVFRHHPGAAGLLPGPR